jgi:hypothetical protein
MDDNAPSSRFENLVTLWYVSGGISFFMGIKYILIGAGIHLCVTACATNCDSKTYIYGLTFFGGIHKRDKDGSPYRSDFSEHDQVGDNFSRTALGTFAHHDIFSLVREIWQTRFFLLQ